MERIRRESYSGVRRSLPRTHPVTSPVTPPSTEMLGAGLPSTAGINLKIFHVLLLSPPVDTLNSKSTTPPPPVSYHHHHTAPSDLPRQLRQQAASALWRSIPLQERYHKHPTSSPFQIKFPTTFLITPPHVHFIPSIPRKGEEEQKYATKEGC